MLQLYQAEWCPHSRKVRQRLTELGVEFLARQVAPEPDDRDDMRAAVGDDEIPLLVREDGSTVVGEEDILRWVDDAYTGAKAHEEQHRAKALDKAGLPG
jgi:glutathione S-transferase